MSQRKLVTEKRTYNYGSSNINSQDSNSSDENARLLLESAAARLPQFLNKQAAAYETDVEIDYAASDGEYHSTESMADFGDVRRQSTMTGRQRKKLAARSKGGEFQARRKKRRVYFCCICRFVNITIVIDTCGTSLSCCLPQQRARHPKSLRPSAKGPESV